MPSTATRLTAFSLATFLLLSAQPTAQVPAPPGAAVPPVTTVASAEAAVPQVRAELRASPAGWNHRLAPDGKQVAWLVLHPGRQPDPATPAPLDRLELLVVDGPGQAPRATSWDVSCCWGTGSQCGPVWSPDGQSVLVGYHVAGAVAVTDVRVDRVGIGATPRPFLRREAARLGGIAASRDGSVIAVVLHAIQPRASSLCVFDREGKQLWTADLTDTGCRAASPSPDGSRIAVVADAGLFVVDARGERRLLDIASNERGPTGCPQWLEDGKSFVVALGGEVVHASLEKGEVHRWSAADLGGSVAAVVILPGDCIVGAITLQESEATMADVILYAGCAPQRVHAGLRWLDLRDGSHARSASQNQRMLGGSVLTYLPRLGELIAAYAR